MDRTHRALSSIAWTLLLVGAAMAPVVVGPAAAAVGNEDARPDAYAIEQNGRCIPVTPIGDGSRNVSEYYDYRSEGGGFSSHGTRDVQVRNVSQLYVYRGSAGDSLVVLHDRYGENVGGGSASMTFTGVPDDWTWPVVDDDYDEPDDQYDTGGTAHTMHWMWAPNRTDGGALRGVAEQGYDDVRIDATFGNDSYGAEEREPPWPYADDNVSWAVRNGEGELVSLAEDADVTFRRGDCSPPRAALTASPNSPSTGEIVTFDASDSSDGGEILEYRWDVDGDDPVDEVTDGPTHEHGYSNEGTVTASVEVVDDSGSTATATTTVRVTRDDPPTASLSAPNSSTVGGSVTLDASASTDDDGIEEYRWDLDDNGTVDETTTDPRIETAYDTVGEYFPTVTVVDSADQSDQATATIDVMRQSFTTSLSANRTTVAPGEAVSFDAEATPASLADGYRYAFGDGVDATGATAVHAYDEPGEYTVTINVSSTDGRYATATTGVIVESDDAEAPGDGGDGGPGGGGGGGAALSPPGTPSIDAVSASLGESSVETGTVVGVSVRVENSGDGDGTTRLALAANGERVATMHVFVGSNTTKRYRIGHTFAEPGEYGLSVNGTSAGTLTVEETGGEETTDGPVGDVADVGLVDLASPSGVIAVGEPARIGATLENRGDESVTVDVALRVEGEVSSVKTSTVGGGATRTVTFNRTFASVGEYEVGVDGTNRTVVVADGGPAGTPAGDGNGENSGPGDPLLFGVVGVVALVGAVLGLSRWV